MFRRIKQLLIKKNARFEEIYEWNKGYYSNIKNSKVNLGKIQSALNLSDPHISKLADVEFQIFSQFGDDGIIQYLIQKMNIANKTFIEFGVEDYRESNTRFLLVNNYWSGFVIDGSKENISRLKSEQLYSFFDIKAVARFINAENINDILSDSGFGKEVGLLSIDIDGNDYWVWEAIETTASIVVCEYNGLFGFEDKISVPYDPHFVRGRKLPFNCYGASLKALCQLADQKGYFFIGCNSAGNNAYFVRRTLQSQCPFPEISVGEGYVYPSFTEFRDGSGEMRKGLEPMRLLDGLILTETSSRKGINYDYQRISNSLKESGKIRREF